MQSHGHPRELDRGRRVQRADEIAAAALEQVPRRADRVQRLHEPRRRPLAALGDRAGDIGQIAAARHSGQQRADRGLALPLQDAVDGPLAMAQQVGRDERGAVPAHEDEARRLHDLDRLRQVDDLRHVRQIVAGEADRVRPPAPDHAEQVAVRLDLQVEDPDLVPALPRGAGDQLQPKRLETQEDARVHQTAGMDGEQLHRRTKGA